MKVDRRRPSHWGYLIASGLVVAAARVLRALWPCGTRAVALYGHQWNGNLKALYGALVSEPIAGCDVVVLCLDRQHAVRLRHSDLPAVWLGSPTAILWLWRAGVIISDHGLHTLVGLLGAPRLRFVDVWHGIPFKGFDADDFRIQHRFDEIWVASSCLARLYVERFGFAPVQVAATGYARTDQLVRRPLDTGMRHNLGIPEGAKVVVFAPTWAQDAAGRSVFPFGADEETFLRALVEVVSARGGVLLLRTHLNSRHAARWRHPCLRDVPSFTYPDAEALLAIADVLVCDWSSIAFDYLLLDRPTLFLDVPPPFRKGFSLGPQYRYGPVVGDLGGLCGALMAVLDAPEAYWREHGARHLETKAEVYGTFADGQSATRGRQRIEALLRI